MAQFFHQILQMSYEHSIVVIKLKVKKYKKIISIDLFYFLIVA